MNGELSLPSAIKTLTHVSTAKPRPTGRENAEGFFGTLRSRAIQSAAITTGTIIHQGSASPDLPLSIIEKYSPASPIDGDRKSTQPHVTSKNVQHRCSVTGNFLSTSSSTKRSSASRMP